MSYAVVTTDTKLLQSPRCRRRRPPARRQSYAVCYPAFRGHFYWDGRGKYRVFNAAEYWFYRSKDGAALEVYDFNATLPYEPTDTFSDGMWHIALMYFNGVIASDFLPIGPNGEPYLRIDVTGGAATDCPPNGPLDWRLEQGADGVVRVHGAYYQLGSLRAAQWALAYTTDGTTPAADSPDATPTIPSGGPADLAHDLLAQAHGTVVKVRLQTRRQDDVTWVYSENSVVKTIAVDATGPGAPLSGENWTGMLPEDA